MAKQTRAKLKVIITGATGMVGEGVLIECLQHEAVKAVLLINRRSCGLTHPKLKEIIHSDFFDLSSIEQQLKGYNACFFCLGVSSVGMKEKEYYRLTYELTMHAATMLSRLNPEMTFCYVSGAGTDSSEQGRIMWARVKGKTENELTQLPFKGAYNFRPGFLEPTQGMKNIKYYKYISWLIPLLRNLTPKYICSLRELGLAMIHAATQGYEKQVLEVPDIIALAKR
ncbi:NAD-dependent epimerase/dehydratase family protein [Catalinimonas niigatensis]|uniref:NAD-dependent epimerase/dehydratase family protein n=1 Tax=Catalinimonas niigatensis TaxID=1397264 RepID=UPI002665F1B5|nr:NAD-dependent epimerase/dehydratase family protein [Catalinimonas niigatensis]WPP49482.1 epimerase [Catalinimonas niigatensis]